MSEPGWENAENICDSNYHDANECNYCGADTHSMLDCPHAPLVDADGIACGAAHPQARTLREYSENNHATQLARYRTLSNAINKPRSTAMPGWDEIENISDDADDNSPDFTEDTAYVYLPQTMDGCHQRIMTHRVRIQFLEKQYSEILSQLLHIRKAIVDNQHRSLIFSTDTLTAINNHVTSAIQDSDEERQATLDS